MPFLLKSKAFSKKSKAGTADLNPLEHFDSSFIANELLACFSPLVPCRRARLSEPISDSVTLAVAKQFGVNGLLEHVARARKRALGSHFPRTEFS